jgi:hypothetical protein
MLVEVVARLCRNREARGNGQSDPRHLREARAFAPQKVAHLAVALRFARAKKVNEFQAPPPNFSRQRLASSKTQIVGWATEIIA